MKWKLQPQECEGSYYFSGLFLITKGIDIELSEREINSIYCHISALVKSKDGLDYLQVFVHEETGQKLFFIDQLNREMIDSGEYRDIDNYCTLMFAHEY